MSQSELYSTWKTRKSPQNLMGRKNIKIQTNGIMIPKLVNVFVDKLVNFRNIAFTFEVSLKGTNPNEFEILSGGLRGEMFYEQIRAITELRNYEDQGCPIFVRGILGIFHSAQYDLVFPDNDERMMLNPDRQFIETVTKLRNLSRTQERVYVEPLRFTDQMRETESNCKNLGIITSSKVGKNIEPGKKIRLKNTYLWKVINREA